MIKDYVIPRTFQDITVTDVTEVANLGGLALVNDLLHNYGTKPVEFTIQTPNIKPDGTTEILTNIFVVEAGGKVEVPFLFQAMSYKCPTAADTSLFRCFAHRAV